MAIERALSLWFHAVANITASLFNIHNFEEQHPPPRENVDRTCNFLYNNIHLMHSATDTGLIDAKHNLLMLCTKPNKLSLFTRYYLEIISRLLHGIKSMYANEHSNNEVVTIKHS